MSSKSSFLAWSVRSCGLFALAAAFALMVLFSAPAFSQVQNGVFTGTVMDPQGASIPNATVAVTNLGTGQTTAVQTNAEGLYRATELPVGLYRLTVKAQGFKTVVQTNLPLTVGAITTVNFKLEIGEASQTVTVEAGAVQVQTDDSRLSETIGAGQVANLPLNGRNVFDLIRLAPGAVDVTGVDFENGHSTVINGLRPNFSGFLVNGVSDKGLSGGVVTVPNADIVEEFQELTLNMSAQYGNSASAIINVVTKTGTNSFHGSAYEFNRNDMFDANDTFRNASGDPNQDKAPAKLRFNQFGATLEGPIWKDHLFFTASYQGERFTTVASPITTLVESPEWRSLVESASLTKNSVAAKIYHDFPAVTNGNPANPNSFTLANYINGNAGASGSGFAAFGDYMCTANYPAGFTGLAGRFQALFGVTPADQTYMAKNCPSGAPPLQTGAVTNRNMPFLNEGTLVFGSKTEGNLFNGNEWSTRIDWIHGNDRVFGEYYWQHSTDPFGGASAGSSMHGFRNPTASHSPNFSSSWVHTFSANWVNEARAGYVLNRTDVGVAAPGVPAIGFDDGSSGFGSYNGYPQYFHENIYSYSDMMTFQRGRHSIKVGADFRRNLENSEFNIARPSYSFMDQLFFTMDAPYAMFAGTDPGFINNQPAQLADNFRHWRNLEVGAYIQDDWKVNRKLTLNLGLRWDLFTRHKEKQGLVTNFIPGPGCQYPADGFCADWIQNANIPAGQPGCNTPTQLQNNVLAGVCGPGGFAVANSLGAGNHKNFGPRIGFAIDPTGNGKTAIRGGFGISYEGTLYNPLSNSRWNPPFYNFDESLNGLSAIEGVMSGYSTVVYGPTASCDGTLSLAPYCVNPYTGLAAPVGVAACNPATTACLGSGAAVTYTGAPANPGIGTGVQGTGNIQGFYGEDPKFAFLTGLILPQGLRDPHIFNYYFGIQHEILPKTVLEVDYVGTMGRNLFRAEQINRLPGIALKKNTVVKDQFGRTLTGLGRRYLNPNYAVLRMWDNVSKSWYDSLQVTVRHQATHGLAFNVDYAWSHSIDTGSGWHSSTTTANGAAGGDGYSTDPTLPNLDRGNSTFDIRHRLSFNYVYDIPFMKDQKGFAGHVLGGWQYQGIWAYQTGAHFTPFCAVGTRCDFNRDGTRNDRPNAPNGNTFNPTSTQWMNGWFPNSQFGCAWTNSGTCANGQASFFSTPCLGCNGNLARNTFVGPSLFSTDQSLFKNIKMTERLSFQFRFEVFNALNHPSYKLPSSATGANFANEINNSNFGTSAGEIAPRAIQFGLKLLW